MTKQIYRSRSKKIIAGVCGGIGDYFNIDAVIIRIVWLFLFFAGGVGLLVYIIAWIIIPTEPIGYYHKEDKEETKNTPLNTQNTKMILGIIFVVAGIFFILNRFLYFNVFIEQILEFTWQYFVPVACIAIGIYLIVQKKNGDFGKNKRQNKETRDFT